MPTEHNNNITIHTNCPPRSSCSTVKAKVALIDGTLTTIQSPSRGAEDLPNKSRAKDAGEAHDRLNKSIGGPQSLGAGSVGLGDEHLHPVNIPQLDLPRQEQIINHAHENAKQDILDKH